MFTADVERSAARRPSGVRSPPGFVRLAGRFRRIRLRARRTEHGIEDRRRLTLVALRPIVPRLALFLSHAPSFWDGCRFRWDHPGKSPARGITRAAPISISAAAKKPFTEVDFPVRRE
jgi:hypothetical protein